MACAVAAVVTYRQRVLFGKRRTKSTGFEWQLPGGWIKCGETPVDAVAREVLEETGLSLETPRFVAVTNNLFSPQRHSVTLYFEAECVAAESLRVLESDKCIDWQWLDWSEVNEGLFYPLELLKNTNYRPFSPGQLCTGVSI